LISTSREAIEQKILKNNAKYNNINNQRMVDIFIIAVYAKDFSNLTELTKKQEVDLKVADCVSIIENLYSLLSEEQKKTIKML
jgi:hypothetical protein